MTSPRATFYYKLAACSSIMAMIDIYVHHDLGWGSAGLFVTGIMLYLGNWFNRMGM